MLDTREAIALMQRQLDQRIENRPYDDPQVTVWMQLSKRIVEETFGKEHINYRQFAFAVGHYRGGRSIHQQDFEQDVQYKKSKLTAYIEELRMFPNSTDPIKPDPLRFRRKLLSEIADANGQPEQPYCDYRHLPSSNMWAHSFILEQLEILALDGRIELKRLPNSDEAAVKVTPLGRKSLEVEEHIWQQQKAQYPVSHNTVKIHNSHIGNLAQVFGSSHANVHQSTSATGLAEIFKLVEAMTAQIKASAISEDQKNDAELEAAQLKAELQKSSPNVSRLKEMLKVFGSLNAAAQFGEKLPHLVSAIMAHMHLSSW